MQKKKNYTGDQMFELIEAWRLSGLSQIDFCKQKELSKSTFGYWLKKHKKQENKTGRFEENPDKVFLPVKITSAQEQASCHTEYITITYPNGVKVCCPLNPVQ